jgi:hypothetical protein
LAVRGDGDSAIGRWHPYIAVAWAVLNGGSAIFSRTTVHFLSVACRRHGGQDGDANELFLAY